MKKILITGGAGFMGSNSALHFAKNGWKIYLIDNLSRKGAKDNLSNLKKNIKLTFYKVDVSNFSSVSNIIRKIKPSLLIHCAGQVAVTKSLIDPRTDFNSNFSPAFKIWWTRQELNLRPLRCQHKSRRFLCQCN